MVWNADVRMYGIPITGFDRLIAHAGTMQWKVMDFIPLIHATGRDITRSSVGRMLAESVWLPSVLCRKNILWTSENPLHVSARIGLEGEESPLTLALDNEGQLQSISINRWGNPDGGVCRYIPFGGVIEEEKEFGGYTIPSRLCVGWHFKSARFDTEGEFFRCTIDHAEFC